MLYLVPFRLRIRLRHGVSFARTSLSLLVRNAFSMGMALELLRQASHAMGHP